MSRNVSIAISAKDNFSQTIITLRNASTAFNKDLEGMQKKLDALDDTKHTIKLDLDKAKRELKEAEKAFRGMDEAARDDTALREAEEKYDNLRRQLAAVGKEAKQTEKDILNLSDANNRASNRAFGGSSGGGNSISGSFSALAKAGLGNMIGASLGQATNAAISSAFGGAAGNTISSTLSGAVSGAAMGSMAGPLGTVVGGVVGAASGLISGATQAFEEKDASFKSYYQEQYNGITSARAEKLQSGSGIAAQREIDQIAFEKLLGGKDTASDYLGRVVTLANSTPFLYSDLTAMSKTLAPAFGDDPDEMIRLLTGIGDAGASVGLDVSGMNMVATAMGRMQSTGKTTLEYLNFLQERGIDAYQFIADGLGTTKGKALEAVSQSKVAGQDAVNWILGGMEQIYSGAMELQSKTFSGLASTLQGMQEEINNAMGEGYNSARSSGIAEQIGFFQGEDGEGLKKAYSAMGSYQAELENLKEEYEREALSAVMTGKADTGLFGEGEAKRLEELSEQYQEAMASGDKFYGRFLEMATAVAENAYNADNRVRNELDNQLEMVNTIRDNASLQDAYHDAGYRMGQEFTKGLLAAQRDNIEDIDPNSVWNFKADTSKYRESHINRTASGGYKRAMGVPYIPRDNYPILAHEGERLLTAQEARGYGSGANVTVTGNSFTVREEADVDRIARELVRQFELQRMASGLTVGRGRA